MWGLVFSLGVVVISIRVMLFSEFYIAEEKNKIRFVILVSLFVLCMNMLIFFPRLIVLLLGWDGLGLVSFILVVYYQTPKALGAGMITALMRRVGDVILLLRIGLIVNRGG
jgi:NADH-ubiquinone oxidoreductase chain 5